MTAQTSQIVLAATNTAHYRDFILGFQTAMLNVGLTLSADTGQIDLTGSTVPYPSTYTTGAYGVFVDHTQYQIYQMVAAGLPTLYVRVDYGINGNSGSVGVLDTALYPHVQISVGLITDGAGGLTLWPGTSSTAVFESQSGYNTYTGSSGPNTGLPSLNPQECDFASDGKNYLTIMLGENAGAYESKSIFVLGIERTIDATSGNYDNSGIVGFCATGVGTTWYYLDIASQLQHTGTTSLPSITPPFHIGTNDSTTVYTFPFIGSTIVPKGAPTVGVAYYNLNVTSTLSFPQTLYSVAHNYKCCPRSTVNADPYSTGSRIALRFD